MPLRSYSCCCDWFYCNVVNLAKGQFINTYFLLFGTTWGLVCADLLSFCLNIFLSVFHWATECGIEIRKFSSNEIDNVFNQLNIIDAKIQLQTIVSIGIFEANPNSEL